MNYKIICSGRIFKAVSFTIILALLLTFTVPQTSYAGQISHGAKDNEENDVAPGTKGPHSRRRGERREDREGRNLSVSRH